MEQLSAAQWASKHYNQNAPQVMLWPVVIYANGRSIGMGTLVKKILMTGVVTAGHLFSNERGIQTYTFQALGYDTLFGLLRPSVIPKVGTADAVIANITTEASVFLGEWTQGTASKIRNSARLASPQKITSLLSGEMVELTNTAVQADGSQLLSSPSEHPLGAGSSGSGYLSDTGCLHILLGRGDNEKVTYFSREINVGPV